MSNPNPPIGAGLGGGGLWPAHVPRPVPRGAPRPADAGPVRVEDRAPFSEMSEERLPWKGVQWTLVYIGFLAYIFAITTYALPIGEASIVVALIGLFTQKEKLRVPPYLVGLTIFLVWASLGYAVSKYPDMVVERVEVFGKLLLIALVAANALRTRAQIRFFVVFWLGCFALYPVRGALFNYYIYGESMMGRAIWKFTFNNPNDLAAFAILQLSMALGLLALEKRGPIRLATRIGVALLPLLILLTKSRGAFLGFAAFMLLILAVNRRRGRAIMITAVVSTLVISIAPDDVLNRVFGLKKITSTETVGEADTEGSAFQRYEIWKVARLMIRENPIVGVGLGAYPAEHWFYARRPGIDPTARGRRDTHSTYLNLAAETGIVGAMIYLISCLATIIRADTVRRRAKTLMPGSAQTLFALEAGTLGFFIAAIFGSLAYVSFIILHMVLVWAIAEVVASDLAAYRRGPAVPGPTRVNASIAPQAAG